VLRRLLIYWAIAAVAVAFTAWLVPGIHIDGGFGALLLIAAVWGLVDSLLGPIVRLLSLPLTVLTFGLFALIVNGFLFLVTDWLVGALHVDGFGDAVLGALVISIVSTILHMIEMHRQNRRLGLARR
jgi:putative membrane protein